MPSHCTEMMGGEKERKREVGGDKGRRHHLECWGGWGRHGKPPGHW